MRLWRKKTSNLACLNIKENVLELSTSIMKYQMSRKNFKWLTAQECFGITGQLAWLFLCFHIVAPLDEVSLVDDYHLTACVGLPGTHRHGLELLCVCAKLLQSCLTLCDSVNCSPPGSSVHGIQQARILEWVAMPHSRGSSQHRNGTRGFCVAGRLFTAEPLGKPLELLAFVKLQRCIFLKECTF